MLAACSGFLQDAVEYFRAQNLGGGMKFFGVCENFALGKKMRARMVSPPVTCTM